MRICAIIGILFCSILSWGQASNETKSVLAFFDRFLREYQATDDISASPAELVKFTASIQERKATFKNDLSFLNHLFYKTHNRFLKHYQEYAPFSEVLSGGNYNCLTGTALYALLLDRLGYDFTIVETNYHIFLVVNSGSAKVLFEATDPKNGFVSNPYAVNERISLYKQNLQTRDGGDGKVYYQYRSSLYNEVSMKQLTGLLYYNLAVKAYNRQQLAASVSLLKRAMEYYTSPRMEEFSSIILLTLEESNMQASEKQAYIRQIKSLGSQQAVDVNSAEF